MSVATYPCLSDTWTVSGNVRIHRRNRVDVNTERCPFGSQTLHVSCLRLSASAMTRLAEHRQRPFARVIGTLLLRAHGNEPRYARDEQDLLAEIPLLPPRHVGAGF